MPGWATATNRFILSFSFFSPASQILNNRKENPGKLSLMFSIWNSKFQNGISQTRAIQKSLFNGL